ATLCGLILAEIDRNKHYKMDQCGGFPPARMHHLIAFISQEISPADTKSMQLI
ncbi:hypothetical protein BaRGS_00012451, partial [Batillaria attramentaria]